MVLSHAAVTNVFVVASQVALKLQRFPLRRLKLPQSYKGFRYGDLIQNFLDVGTGEMHDLKFGANLS